jgi:RNA polymerase sigma-70 factor (ECF subfamily)
VSQNLEEGEEQRRLLAASLTGDTTALGQLLELFRSYLLAIAGQELPGELAPKVGASDVVQETFLEVYRLIAQFHGDQPDDFRAWLRQVLVYKLSETRRHYLEVQKRQVARECSLDESGEVGALGDVLPGSGVSPSGEAVRNEQSQALATALGRLPELYRQVITWRTWEAVPFAEIGRRLGRTEDAARALYTRAMARLQEEMANPDASRPPDEPG